MPSSCYVGGVEECVIDASMFLLDDRINFMVKMYEIVLIDCKGYNCE